MSSQKVAASITVSIMECTEAELTAIEDAIYESIKPFIASSTINVYSLKRLGFTPFISSKRESILSERGFISLKLLIFYVKVFFHFFY